MIKTRFSVRPTALALGFALVALLGACSDSTGPDIGDFDPESVASSLDEVLSTSQVDEDVLVSLELAGEVLADQGGMAPVLLPAGRQVGGLLPRLDDVRRAELAAPIFPSNLLGKTFVYDVETDDYVIDDAATGAPANGIRLLYYAIDPVTRRPVDPLVELGYLDLTDESTASSTRLGIEVVSTSGDADVTLIDYFIDASYAATESTLSVTLLAEGYLSDGSERLNFELSQSVDIGSDLQSAAFEIDHTLELVERGVTVTLHAAGSGSEAAPGSADFDALLTIQEGGETVEVDVTLVDAETSEIEGAIRYNGATAIVIGGTGDEPTFTRPDGSPLGPAEVDALIALRDGIETVMQFAVEIFAIFST